MRAPWWLLVAGAMLLLCGCEPAAPAPTPSPLPAKVVAGKVERPHLLDPTTYHLVAEDSTVCTVSMPQYALARVGERTACAWREWW